MIKSLVDPKNTEVVSDINDIKGAIKGLGPNDMLIYCAEKGKYIVGDYKGPRAAVESFDDAMACAQAMLGALKHYERVLTKADNKFSQLEGHLQKMNKIFREMKNEKRAAEAKQRRDNPEPAKTTHSGTNLDPKLIEKIMAAIQKTPTVDEQVKLKEAEAKDTAAAGPDLSSVASIKKLNLHDLTSDQLLQAIKVVDAENAQLIEEAKVDPSFEEVMEMFFTSGK